MLLTIPNKGIYPSEVLDLFQAFHDAGFFEESMLIGSWVMPLYQSAFGIPYALRTLDIGFAVKFAASDKNKKADLEQCSVIAGQHDPDRLAMVLRSIRLSAKTRKALRASCESIHFPPEKLGLR